MKKSKPAAKSNKAGYAVSGALGGALGFGLSGIFRQSGNTEIIKLLARQMAMSTYGPVIAVGLAAGAAIICAVAIPAVVVRSIKKDKGEHHE